MLVWLHIGCALDMNGFKTCKDALVVREIHLYVLTGQGIDALEGLVENAEFLGQKGGTLRSYCGGLKYEWNSLDPSSRVCRITVC
jgi:hypothetical protein